MLTGDVDLFPTSGFLISGEVRGDDNAAGKENTPSTTSLDFLEVWPSGNLGAMKQELREVKFQSSLVQRRSSTSHVNLCLQ